MKAIKMLLTMMLVSVAAYAAEPRIQVEGGAYGMNENTKNGTVGGFRVGTTNGAWALSAGYLRMDGEVDGDKLLPGDMTLHTMDIELYRVLPLGKSTAFKVGVGGGYTVANLNSNASEKLQNGMSEIVGGGIAYAITNHLSFGINAKYFFFNTESRRTTAVVSREDILVGGVPSGTVETVDYVPSVNSINLNSLILTAALTYRF